MNKSISFPNFRVFAIIKEGKKIFFCISITFDNPLKVYFSSKKYLIAIQTRPTQIVISIFLIEKPVFNQFLNIIGVQNNCKKFNKKY